jgi:16S rRNA (cytidine1402-2'-O)-methyltransferase
MTDPAPAHTPSKTKPAKPKPAKSKPPAAKQTGDDLSPGLYIVATPIGHADDITLRALKVLNSVDLIVCEDTRHTGRLLQRHGVSARLLAYYEHNAAKVRPKLLAKLQSGARLALVSDAGTPLISDPGYKLVRDAIAGGCAVHSIPGASALLAALVVAGLPTDRFFFVGFLAAKSGHRLRDLGQLAAIPATLVFYETGPRLALALADMAKTLGPDRPACVARELTKLHEEVRRESLANLARHYAEAGPPKGEIVVVVGAPDAGALSAADRDPEAMAAALRRALQTSRLSEAVDLVAGVTGASRREVYALALRLRGES